MGLMTLLSRKLNSDKNRQIRAPTYERQVTSRSPMRRVDSPLPVNANGSSPSEDMRSSVSKRPSTAPIGNLQFGQSQQDLSASRSTSPTSTRHSQFTSPQPLPSHLQSSSRSGTPTYMPSYRHRPQQSVSSSRRASTIRTELGPKRTYVDLLDAQSAITPSDFHSRVRASGARDYGEDVADRNIIVNGLDVQATKAQSIRAQSAMEMRRPMSCEPPVEEEENEDLHQHVLKQTSIDAAMWSKSLSTPSSHHSKPPRQSTRHQSLSSLTTGGSTKPAHKRATPSGSRSLQISVGDANKSASHRGPSSPPATPGSPATAAHPSPRYARSTSSLGRMSPAISVTSKHNTIAEYLHEEEDVEPELYINDQPVLSPQPTPYRISAFTEARRPSTRQSARSANCSVTSSLAQRSTTADVPGLPDYIKEKGHSFKPDWIDDMADRESAPSPSIKKSRARSHSFGEEADEYLPIRGVVSPRRGLQSTIVEEHVPVRSSSIRHWSMSSATPTTSSSGSTTFHRPQSQHTANTSVDLSSRTYSSLVNSSFSSLNTSPSAYQHSEIMKKGKAPETDVHKMPTFNIDDYISDDDSFTTSQKKHSESEEDLLFDSGYGASGIQLPGLEDAFAAPAPVVKLRKSPLSKQSYPEDLHSVYGDLHEDDLYAPALTSALQTSTLKYSSGGLLHILALENELSSPEDFDVPRTRTNDSTLSPSAVSETMRMAALMDSSSNSSHTTPTIRDGAHSSQSYQRRFAAGHHTRNLSDETIEEESSDRLSIATAIRMRKEAKSKKRASQISSSTETRRSSQSRSLSRSSMMADESTDSVVEPADNAKITSLSGSSTDEESSNNYESCNSEPMSASEKSIGIIDVADLSPGVPQIRITAE